VSLDPERLGRALGGDALLQHEPLDVAGVKLATTLRPADGERLAAALRLLDEAGAAALVRGRGTRLGFGNAPRRADLLLETTRLAGIDVLDADEGVAHAAAGTPLAELHAAAREAGWELPIEAPSPDATLGGALASAAAGPRVLRHGPPRDHVLGLRVALATGERTTCGGRVVKNVTGYDLMKLHCGAFGTLGVIEAAWLRLRPLPEETRVLCAWLPEGEPGFAPGLAAARLGSARAVALVDPALAGRVDPGGPVRGRRLLVVELGGAPEEVRRDRAALEAHDPAEVGPEALQRLAALQETPDPAHGLRFRLVLRPTRLEAAAAPLARAGAALLAYPGAGFLFAGFPLYEGADELAVDAAWRAARDAARAGGGSFALEAAPLWAKSGRDVFGDPPEALALMRALKARFDPRGVLNPGRFVGGI